MHARLDVLCTGYAAERVASTVVLVRDGGAVIVVDPGMRLMATPGHGTPFPPPELAPAVS